MADLETAASKPLVAPGRLRRPQLFLIFGALSFVWLGALMWMMHGMHNGGEHLEEQMDFAGADIDSLYGVEDAVKCRIACEEHPRCLAFTYVKTDKACWLKGQGYSAKSNPNTISGSINETLKIARLSALNHSHDGRRAHGQRWRSSNEGEDVPEYEDDAQEEGDDSEGGLEGGLEDGSDYTGFTEQSSERSPVVLTDEDVERYNDSTTFLGDVRLLVDVSIPVDEEHRTWDADAGVDEGEREFSEDDLEMHSEPELDDLDDLALEDGAPGADGWLRGSREDDDADALEVVYDGASLAAPELDEDTAHIFDDTELVGGDVHQLSHTHTVLACRDACASYVAPPASPPCRAWTLAKEAGHCWLKSKDATRQSVSKAAGRISGVLPMNGTMLGAGLQMKLDNSSVVNDSSRLVLSRTPLTSPPEQRAKQIGARRAKRTV
ncbi:hypothetical protein Ctob_001279 [Chrysochromulina tobinii]|uniref:Apple domain-containing protein n=1 Tax=Chrysochromulina tobinii TaxID=1460289 RepID=A0A0M0J502_9EUKA|nr:hypothetical protein Ctob_001279 [Chrysochromulina tobinii]|eukprot:KOO21699.1 hypothetical protein Ctob_001279 [Chrysochromulina sp. CCMP291]